MFARVVTVQGAPGRTPSPDLLERAVQAAQKQPGFKALYVLADRGTGKLLSISLWETEQQAKALEQAGAQMRQEAVSALGATMAPTDEVYEVAAQSSSEQTWTAAKGSFARVYGGQAAQGQDEVSIRLFQQGLPGFHRTE